MSRAAYPKTTPLTLTGKRTMRGIFDQDTRPESFAGDLIRDFNCYGISHPAKSWDRPDNAVNSRMDLPPVDFLFAAVPRMSG